jgi:hypothetical protein
LLEQKEKIERELDTSLEWHERPKGTESRILVRLQDADPANPKKWSEQHEWLKQILEAFYMLFKRRAAQLNLPDIMAIS